MGALCPGSDPDKTFKREDQEPMKQDKGSSTENEQQNDTNNNSANNDTLKVNNNKTGTSNDDINASDEQIVKFSTDSEVVAARLAYCICIVYIRIYRYKYTYLDIKVMNFLIQKWIH